MYTYIQQGCTYLKVIVELQSCFIIIIILHRADGLALVAIMKPPPHLALQCADSGWLSFMVMSPSHCHIRKQLHDWPSGQPITNSFPKLKNSLKNTNSFVGLFFKKYQVNISMARYPRYLEIILLSQKLA